MIPVKDCLAYMTSLGYVCHTRKRGYYYFRNEQRAVGNPLREVTCTLSELRDLKRYGF